MADLIVNLLFAADARQTDEGRSFFAKKGGGNRVGEQIVGEKVRLYSDPAHPLAPAIPSTAKGCRSKRIDWVDKGVLKNLFVFALLGAEAWARTPTPRPGQPDHGRRDGVDGRSDHGHRARRARDALLVHPARSTRRRSW